MTLLRSPLRPALRVSSFSPLVGAWGGPVDPFSLFTYDLNFVAGTVKGGTQPYGSNTNDGRLFRDPNNITATFCPANSDGTGLLVSVASSGVRRTTGGQWAYPSGGTSRTLWPRDLTNVAWVPTSVTPTKNQTGADGSVNAATLIAAAGANGTILQTVTLAVQDHIFAFDIKRVSGSGTLEATIDGGTTWQAISGLTASYQRKFVAQAAVTNPVFGFRIGTSGDSFAIDFANTQTPANSLNIPNQYRLANTSATILSSQSRPNADVADLGPIGPLAQGAFAFYWQGRSERASGGFLMTGSSGMQCSVQADGSAQFGLGLGVANSNVGGWRVGLGLVNKGAGFVTAGGLVKFCLNGGNVGSDTDAVLAAALTHFDISTNGAGQNSIYGPTERVAFGANLTFTDAQLVAMTT